MTQVLLQTVKMMLILRCHSLLRCIAVSCAIALLPAMAVAVTGSTLQDGATLLMLDKRTTHVSTITLSNGEAYRFDDAIIIEQHQCYTEDSVVVPEHTAKVVVRSSKETMGMPLFAGWLFAIKSELTSLQHPKYDISLKECITLDVEEETAD